MRAKKLVIMIKKSKSERLPRIPKPKINMDTAADAIVNGQLVVPIGTKVVIPRVRGRKNVLSVCVIDRVERGAIYVWDETLTQWFVFKLSDPVIVKVYKSVAVVPIVVKETIDEQQPPTHLSYVISDSSSET